MLIDGETGISHETYIFVWRRDAGLCQHPECQSEGMELHHRVFRSAGGSHKPKNLVLLCTEHHWQAHNVREWGDHWRNWEPIDYTIIESIYE